LQNVRALHIYNSQLFSMMVLAAAGVVVVAVFYYYSTTSAEKKSYYLLDSGLQYDQSFDSDSTQRFLLATLKKKENILVEHFYQSATNNLERGDQSCDNYNTHDCLLRNLLQNGPSCRNYSTQLGPDSDSEFVVHQTRVLDCCCCCYFGRGHRHLRPDSIYCLFRQ
jgi:hypothetical protein